jgi:hypothetical protein
MEKPECRQSENSKLVNIDFGHVKAFFKLSLESDTD